MINFYEHPKIKKYLTKEKNPHFKDHQIKLNTRTLVIGSSGSGKTNFLLNFLKLSPSTFNHIHLVLKQSDEPLYQLLINSMKPEDITVYTSIDKLPELDALPKLPEDQDIVIFDDQLADQKGLKGTKMGDYFIRSRKKNITLFFLAQTFYDIPKLIRCQMTYLIIIKVSNDDDLKLIVRNFQLGVDLKKLTDMYKSATKNKFDFFKIDVLTGEEDIKFSHNFKDFFKIKNNNEIN